MISKNSVHAYKNDRFPPVRYRLSQNACFYLRIRYDSDTEVIIDKQLSRCHGLRDLCSIKHKKGGVILKQRDLTQEIEHLIVSEQPIFHVYVDMRGDQRYHLNVYVSPWYKAYNYMFFIQNTKKDKSRQFRTEPVSLEKFLENYVSNDKNTHEHLIREFVTEWIETGIINKKLANF